MSDTPSIHRVLKHYLGRLQTAITRSPLPDASTAGLGRGQKLDLSHLNHYRFGAADDLLELSLQPTNPAESGRVRRIHGSITLVPEFDTLEFTEDQEEGDESIDREQAINRIYRQIDYYLVRQASKIERETGNRCVWLGFPMLHFVERSEPRRSILAPMVLWPVRARLETRYQLAVRIERDWSADGPLTNTIMHAWIKARTNLDLPRPEPTEVPRDRAAWHQWIVEGFRGIDQLRADDLAGPLGPVQRKSTLNVQGGPSVSW